MESIIMEILALNPAARRDGRKIIFDSVWFILPDNCYTEDGKILCNSGEEVYEYVVVDEA